MNAKLLERLIVYRKHNDLAITQCLLSQKIKYQFAITGKRRAAEPFLQRIAAAKTIPDILLIEARAARLYWRMFASKIGDKASWYGREAHRKDILNQLLDIGYHYLSQKITAICDNINLPTELGFFHKAQSGKAHPLTYDFMEPMRPIFVDDVLLKMIAKKKKKLTAINKKIIPAFIYQIKKRGANKYFHRKLGYCIELDYWLRLLLLEFTGSVRFAKPYHSYFPSLRHETRCRKEKTTPMQEVVS